MKRARYIEWFSADEMHEHSKEWKSELSFIKDEILFLQSLISQYAVKIALKRDFQQVQKANIELEKLNVEMEPLLKRVNKHMGQLEIMLDEVDQLEMEKAYRKTHKTLYKETNSFLKSYRKIKSKVFAVLSKMAKTKKLMTGLTNPEYKITKTKSTTERHEKT